MQTLAWYQGESLKRLLQGVAVGAFATLGIGFGWGGFMLGSTAKTLADSTANSAVVAAIAPICVDQFQRGTDAANNLTALKKTRLMATSGVRRKRRLGGDAWQQGGRFRRAPGMRRSAQQPEIGSVPKPNTNIDGRRDARADRPAIRIGINVGDVMFSPSMAKRDPAAFAHPMQATRCSPASRCRNGLVRWRRSSWAVRVFAVGASARSRRVRRVTTR